MGEGSRKLRFGYETSIYTTYIHNNFSCLHRHISEIRVGKLKKPSVKLNSVILMNRKVTVAVGSWNIILVHCMQHNAYYLIYLIFLLFLLMVA